jgi:hypothetical protein
MTAMILRYCDVCKTETQRCEYYPKGRSRQHNACLECNRKDPRIAEGYRSTDPRYCAECDRNQRLGGTVSF